MTGKLLKLSLLFLLSACTQHVVDCNYTIYGIDEFTTESDHIYTEGKYGILELEGKVFRDLPPNALDCYIDTISEDDVLNVVLYHPSRRDLMDSIHFVCERAGGFQVVEGRIHLPDFPPIEVAGLTLSEAKEKLTEQFRDNMKGIEVFLTFRHRPSHKIELIGQVKRDSIEVDGRVRLYEVLAKAFLPPDANLHASYVLREGCPLKVDLNRLIREGDMSQNIVMRPGDKIYIGNTLQKTALVMGEVRRPSPIPLPTGTMSLREAIALSGGIPFTGDDRHIHIIRGDVCQPQIYVISMKNVLQENNNRLLLIPGDVVYVTEKPITRWNIFLQQLQPTLTFFTNAAVLYDVTR